MSDQQPQPDTEATQPLDAQETPKAGIPWLKIVVGIVAFAITVTILGYLWPIVLIGSVALLILAWKRPEAVERLTGHARLARIPATVRATPMRFAIVAVAVLIPVSAIAGSAVYGPDTVEEDLAPVEEVAAAETPEPTATSEPEPEPTITTVPEPTSTAELEVATLPSYNVLQVEDISFGNTKRLTLHVLVESGVSVAQLEAVAEQLAQEYRKSEKYNALNVGFYDYTELIGHGYSLGYWEDVPYGEWKRADEVRSGDYSKHEAVSHLKEKDWSKRPTEDQVAIWAAWQAIVWDLDDEDAATQQIADEFGLTFDDAQASVRAVVFWPF